MCHSQYGHASHCSWWLGLFLVSNRDSLYGICCSRRKLNANLSQNDLIVHLLYFLLCFLHPLQFLIHPASWLPGWHLPCFALLMSLAYELQDKMVIAAVIHDMVWQRPHQLPDAKHIQPCCFTRLQTSHNGPFLPLLMTVKNGPF